MADGFDVDGARQAGYSDDEILQHLTASRSFDVAGAVNAGYSKDEIIQHLASTPAGPRPAQPANAGSWTPDITTQVKDTAKTALAHPGQALLGAANAGYQALKSTMPQNDTIAPVQGGPTQPDPNAPGMGLARAAQKVIHPPQNAGEQAGADIANTAFKGMAEASAIQGGVSALKSVKNWMDVPKALSSDVMDTLNDVAEKEGFTSVTGQNAKTAARSLAQKFINRAQSQYQVVDKAVGGNLKPVQDEIDQLQQTIRRGSPAEAKEAAQQLPAKQQELDGLVQQAKANGVDNAEQLMQNGDKDYSRGQSMTRVASKIGSASDVVKFNGDPHPGKFSTQMNVADRPSKWAPQGDLTNALGQEGRDAIVQNAKDGLDKAKTVSTVKKAAIGGAASIGAGALGAAGFKMANH